MTDNGYGYETLLALRGPGHFVGEKAALGVRLTQQGRAASIGASSESVSRDLAMFTEHGTVSRRRRPIVIVGRRALREFAHSERRDPDSKPRM